MRSIPLAGVAVPLWLEILRLIGAGAVLRKGGVVPRLPPVAARVEGAAGMETLIRRCNRLTRLLTGNSRHSCWFRSYPLAVLLRKRGIPARLNIGLMGLHRQVRGHCWLSLEGRVINERDEASAAAYPVFLGENGFGVAFWVAAGQGEYMSRKAGGRLGD